MSARPRDDLPSDDPYEAGPWALNHRYLQESLEEQLSEELTDLDAWLSPSDSGSVVIPQGSTATASCLPDSDIGLIIFNISPELQPITVMKSLVKIFHRTRMICKSSVLEHASVPIIN
jgi:DNA polymerase sigma